METYQMMNINESSPEYLGAMEIHRQIIANGTIAAGAMVELCRNLKIMRDHGSFIHLGFTTFDDYCETAANIKKRQAYNYISTYERLGPEVLQSNAQLGITKLQMLAQISESDRDELITSGQVDDMSTRHLKELTDELTKAREQISFLQEGLEDAAKETDDTEQLTDQLAARKLEVETLRVNIQAIKDEKAAAIKAAEAEANKKAMEKADKEIAKAKAEANKTAQAAREEGIKAGRESAERSLQAVEKEKSEALARARELEKKLQVQGSQDTVLFALLFDELQVLFNKIISCTSKIAAADPEAGDKYRGAMKKYLGMMEQKI